MFCKRVEKISYENQTRGNKKIINYDSRHLNRSHSTDKIIGMILGITGSKKEIRSQVKGE